MYEYEQKKLKKYLGDSLYDILKVHKCFIAGGMITSLFTGNDINDVDIYFRSIDELYGFLIDLDWTFIVSKTEKAILFKYNKIKIQCIYFDYFDNSTEIFNRFDFTVCMGAYDFDAGEFILHKDFLKHNAQRILRFNSNTLYPIITAMRVYKYIGKGYTISKSEHIRIMLAINTLKIHNFEELKNQTGGMYGENYCNMLKPQDEKEFDIKTISDKIQTLWFETDTSIQNNNNKKEFDEIFFDYDWEKEAAKLIGYKVNLNEKN